MSEENNKVKPLLYDYNKLTPKLLDGIYKDLDLEGRLIHPSIKPSEVYHGKGLKARISKANKTTITK